MHRITKGLDVPISGVPDSTIVEGPALKRVAVVGPDYIGMKPTMLVSEGDTVKAGQPVFSDKKTEGVVFTAPAAGKVVELNRGERRAFQSIVIEIEGEETEQFDAPASGDMQGVQRQQVVDLLVKTGVWQSFRTRPYSKVPAIDSTPSSIFVQAIDTNPLAPDPRPIIQAREQDFRIGLLSLALLTDGAVHLCRKPAESMPGEDIAQVQTSEFEGPHPAGLPGTHIHLLDPVGPNKTVWTINYQDVLAIGHLMSTGQICHERVITVAGPAVKTPRTIRTRMGASISELLADHCEEGENRVISGSVLAGRAVSGPLAYLGRYHMQVSVIAEGRDRHLLGWMGPGNDKFSIRRVFSSALDRTRQFAFTSSTMGSKRAMVPIGMYEDVMPMDIIPTFLLRALITGDTEQSQVLGALELDEEDVGLCTFVCPGKYEYGDILRRNLTAIELEG